MSKKRTTRTNKKRTSGVKANTVVKPTPVKSETVDGITLKGENDQFTLAVWTNGGYTYSISVGEALSQTDMLALVSSVV